VKTTLLTKIVFLPLLLLVPVTVPTSLQDPKHLIKSFEDPDLYIDQILDEISNYHGKDHYNVRKTIFDQIIKEIASSEGIDYYLISAIVQVESSYDPSCVSRKGAVGLMQLMPITAKEMGIRNPHDVKENLVGGIKYLKKLLKRYNNDLHAALAAYNAGPARRHVREARMYAKKVLSLRDKLKNEDISG